MESRFFRFLVLALLISTTVLVVPPAGAQTPTPTPAPAPAYSRPLSRDNGAVPQGDDVEAVQARLSELGFINATAVTGIYGPQTEAAVVAFQEANNLPTNGIVDELIWDVLFPQDQDSPVLPTTVVQSRDPNRVRLEQFGIREESLDGPFDARYLGLRLPASWQLESGASIELDIATFFGGTGTDGESSQFLGGSLDVQFNNVLLGRIFLDKPGNQLVTMPISDTALFVPRPDGSHSLAFILDSGLNCGTDRQTSVVVRSSTVLNLPHTVELPPATLQDLPRPLFQDSPLEVDTAALIVPAEPTMGELQAALTVAATFGNLTRNRVEIPLITENALTATLRNESNLIFIGRAGSIDLVDEVALPETATGGAFAAAEADDGILQIAISPWNPNRSVLVVSGNSDAGVIKASQALSTGNVRSTLDPALSVIAEVRDPATFTNTAELTQTPLITTGLVVERTFADLGYETRTAFGIGAQVFEYTFEMPKGYELSENGHLDVVFAHSSLLSYNVSGILIRVNDQPLSTIRFSDETAQNGNVRVAIPRNSLVSGENKISLSANLVPSTLCIDPNAAGVWGTVRADSLLHLALQPARVTKQVNRNLNAYFDPFTTDPTLGNVAFVLPSNDSGSWNVAAQVAADLAGRVDGSMIQLAVVFGDQTAAVSGTHNLIIIGKPTTQPILAGLSEALPAPFPPNSNQPILGNSRVVYRVPEDLSLGFLEIFRSPWNSERTILGILGSTDEGVQWSSAVLHTPRQRSQLNGTVAVINGEQISVENPTVTDDTSTLATNIVAPTEDSQTFRPLAEIPRPRWVLYVIAAAIGVMWLILAFVGVRTWRRSREHHRST